jgi:nucleotide-binding universal stress UspA family protein
MARILVGYDGSEAARGAATFAAQLARRLNDAVTLAYVVPPTAAEMASVLDPAHAAREHLAYAEELLGKAAAELGPDIQITLQVLGGHPAAALGELARDHDIELVAVGSHGLNPVERALLGSTASRLIRTCRKPVVVIPAAVWRTSGSFPS